MLTFFHQWYKSHGFAESPIDISVLNHIHSCLQNSFKISMNFKVRGIWRTRCESFSNVGQNRLIYTSGVGLSFKINLLWLNLNTLRTTLNGSFPSKNPDHGESNQCLWYTWVSTEAFLNAVSQISSYLLTISSISSLLISN